MEAMENSSSTEHRRLKSDALFTKPVTVPEPILSRIAISRPLSERLTHFLEQLDLSLRRIDAGLM